MWTKDAGNTPDFPFTEILEFVYCQVKYISPNSVFIEYFLGIIIKYVSISLSFIVSKYFNTNIHLLTQVGWLVSLFRDRESVDFLFNIIAIVIFIAAIHFIIICIFNIIVIIIIIIIIAIIIIILIIVIIIIVTIIQLFSTFFSYSF